MTNTVIWTIAIITVLGLLLALVLYLVAKKFKVEEDPPGPGQHFLSGGRQRRHGAGRGDSRP